MFDYLQKFNSLPPEIRAKISSPDVSARVAQLGKKYGINLAATVIKVAVRDIVWPDLVWRLSGDFSLNQETAEAIATDLEKEVFAPLSDYLGIRPKVVASAPVIAPAPIATVPTPTPTPVSPAPAVANNTSPTSSFAVANNQESPSGTPAPEMIVEKKPEIIAQTENQSIAPVQTVVNPVQQINSLAEEKDKKEIASLSENIDDYRDIALLHSDRINAILEVIVGGFSSEFSSNYFIDRFKKIIFTYLRGVRDKVSARHALMKPTESGGLGFDEAGVDKVFKIADVHINELREAVAKKQEDDKNKFKAEQQKVEETKKELPLRDVEYDLASVLAKKKEDEISPRPVSSVTPVSAPEQLLAEPAHVLNIQAPIAENAKPDLGSVSVQPQPQPQPQPQVTTSLPVNANPAQIIEPKINTPENTSSIAPLGAEKIAVTEAVMPVQANDSKAVLDDDEGDVFMGLEAEIEASDKNFNKPASSIPVKPAIPDKFVQPDLTKAKAPDPFGKKKIEDVKYVPRTMGPVEELLYMDLVSFHRLAKNPYDACDKLKAKVRLLEDDNYGKKIEGIRAWRQSYVNRLYLDIGQESIEKSKPVEIVIRDRKEQGREYLTNEEFEAVMDLNRFLRF